MFRTCIHSYKRRIVRRFFRHSALNFLAINKLLLCKFALTDEKTVCHSGISIYEYRFLDLASGSGERQMKTPLAALKPLRYIL